MKLDFLLQMEEIYGNSRIYPWKLNHVDIFLHLESFTQRCFDMTEVCNCMITFGRIDETEDIPQPNFGTSAGPMFEAMCIDMEKKFKESLAQIEKVFCHLFYNLSSCYSY